MSEFCSSHGSCGRRDDVGRGARSDDCALATGGTGPSGRQRPRRGADGKGIWRCADDLAGLCRQRILQGTLGCRGAGPCPSAFASAWRHQGAAHSAPAPWRRFGPFPFAPGLAHLPLLAHGGTKARLIRAKPGAAVSTHSHRGEEWTLVLTGSYHDETGFYRPGDVQSTKPEIYSSPVANDVPG